MQITTKFSIGDKVWAASVSESRVPVGCPVCLGTKKWAATTPSGEKRNIACQECRFGQYEDVFKPETQQLTIGSVRFDTHDAESQIHYMCRETGVGSGTVWPEGRLFKHEADAMAKAEGMLAERKGAHAKWLVDRGR